MTAAPGYMLPTSSEGLPRNLTLLQFIQTVLVGVSGLDGTMVRPKGQAAPPKQPDQDVNWIAFAIAGDTPDANSYINTGLDGITQSQRQEGLELSLTIYGRDALYIAGLIRDGFQIPQNLFALRSANMGFTEVSRALYIPDLVNEIWVTRYEMTVQLRRQVQRTYPIVSLTSATGKIHTVIGNEQYLLDWQAGN